MDLFDVGRTHPLVACILYAAISVAILVAALWPFSRQRLLDRLPIVLTLGLTFVGMAIDDFPEAVPGLFAHVLRRSIWATTTSTEPSGTVVTMPWIEGWQEGTDGILGWIALAGALWGAVNLCRRRAWLSNAIAVGYMLWGFISSFGHILG